MPRSPDSAACPCGSRLPFSHCCQPLLEGQQPAPTAVALMRSRYSAFALGYLDYLIDTHHPDHRQQLTRATLAAQDRETRWLALEVCEYQGGEADDDHGEVRFIARFLDPDGAGELEERSQFVREGTRWYYTRGEPQFRSLGQPGRNTPCPCGSGRKFKRCHLR